MKPRVFLAFLFLLCWTLPAIAGDLEKNKSHPEKTTGNDLYSPFLINNVFNYYGNTGDGSYNKFSGDNEGFEFPKGSGKHVVFQDGIVWGGYHKTTRYPGPKVGGSMYRRGLQAGKILTYGPTDTSSNATAIAGDPTLAKYRVYRVRPDVGPSTLFDQQLESRLQTEEVALTGRYQELTARGIYDQYVTDWIEWPAADGAPFQDVNGNGTYEPAVDIPGIPGADQTLWYVANDLDPWRVGSLYGSPPIGIEMQKTIWGYRRPGAMGNTIFIRARMINKSGAPVDSMYIGQWADADVGDAGEDLVGCDTLLNLGYMYNGYAYDAVYGLCVPAVGFVLLTGPQVPGNPADSAIVNLKFRRGVHSLGLTSFVMFSGGSAIYADPASGSGGDRQMYCLLRGLIARSCDPFIDPTTRQPTPFVASGDPVWGTGWVDGLPFLGPQDRRMLLSAGPFTFAPGDTQEIVVANLAAQGADRLTSVLLLKDGARQVIDEYRTLLLPRPSLDLSVEYPSASTAELSFRLDANRVFAKAATAIVTSKSGVTLQEIQLFDDGLHGDGGAGDYLFGATAQLPVVHDPVTLDVRTTDEGGTSTVFKSLARDVTLAGQLSLSDPIIFSENIYPDGKVNHGENIRFGFRLVNQTIFPLSGLRLVTASSAPGNFLPMASLNAGATWESVYDPANAGSYAVLDAPSLLVQTRYPFPYLIMDGAGNRWTDTLWFPAASSRYYPVWTRAIHKAGWAHGDPGIIAIDRRSVRNHQYLIRAFSPDSAGKPITITLEDSTDGRVLLNRHEFPDSLGHNMPLTDGFRLFRGGLSVPGGRMRSYDPTWTPRVWTSSMSNGLRLEGFNGAIGNAFEFWPSGGVPFERQRSVVIRYAATDSAGKILNSYSPNASFAYRYLQNADQPPARPSFTPFIVRPGSGYPYQDYSTTVPFAAFDQDTTPPRRLMVGYLENNVTAGSVDGRYWPPLQAFAPWVDNTSATGPREWFFIFDIPYSMTPDARLQVDLLSSETPLMWFGTPSRSMSRAIPQENEEFDIITWPPPRSGDVWSFNPVTILGGPDQTIPSLFEVSPNFPNPFNAGTTIKYALPFDARVILRIYNVLGQQIRLVADGNELEGYRTLRWDGKNDQGFAAGSGVYFYRLEATMAGDVAQKVTHIGKMVLVK